VYGPGRGRWTLTERGRAALHRTSEALAIGPSALAWDGGVLTLRIDEVSVPLPGRVRGRVRVHPEALADRCFALDAAGRHRWRPLAPRARVEVALERPALSWSGIGYLDANDGDEPLEAGFACWDWSRAAHGGETLVLYDVLRRAPDGRRGEDFALALRFDRTGEVSPIEPPPRRALPATRWRIARGTRADPGTRAAVLRTLEDTPFYARSLVAATVHGVAATAVHESLSLDRFRAAWVRWLLPFRMPRRAGRG
jgi:carotenoid 1,2-hydratase